MKNKTLAVWLTLGVGALGLHKLYLGQYNWSAKLAPLPTALGLLGVMRARTIGIDDVTSWVLIPILGMMLVAAAMNALFYGLMSAEKWNQRFNPNDLGSAEGATTGFTVCGLVAALGLGTTVLMATLAYTIQHIFEYQLHLT
jgi:hypothetical protein